MATYYVRTDGNDGNLGTSDSAGGAWLTPIYAWSQVSDNDTISVNAGTYVIDSSIAAGTLTYGIYMNAAKIVDWIAVGSVTFQASANETYSLLYIRGNTKSVTFTGFIFDNDGKSNTATVYIHSTAGNEVFTNCTWINGKVKDLYDLGEDSTYDNCTFNSTLLTSHAIQTRSDDITFNDCTFSSTTAGALIKFDGGSGGNLTMDGLTVTSTSYAQGVLIEASGTFLFKDVTVSGATTLGSVLQVDAGGKSGSIEIDNWDVDIAANPSTGGIYSLLSHFTWNIHDSDFNYTHVGFNKAVIQLRDQDTTTISDNVFNVESEAASTEIYLYSTGSTTGQQTVENNTLKSKTLTGYHVFIGSEVAGAGDDDLTGTIISGNDVYGAIYYDAAKTPSAHGIIIGYNIDGVIKENYVNGTGIGIIVKSSGDAYASGGISNNIIINNYTENIYVKGTQDVPIYNNTIIQTVDVSTTGIRIAKNGVLGDSDDCIVKNNVIYSTITAGNFYAILLGVEEFAAGYVIDYNDCFSTQGTGFRSASNGSTYTSLTTWQAQVTAANSINSDPSFNDNYSIKSNSKCKSSGEILSSPYYYQLMYNAKFPDPALKQQSGRWNMGAYSASSGGGRRRRR
jgi:hypothetical protein